MKCLVVKYRAVKSAVADFTETECMLKTISDVRFNQQCQFLTNCKREGQLIIDARTLAELLTQVP